MKNILLGLGLAVLVGGATLALGSREILKVYFTSGDKPTQEQFSDTIDSGVNLQDDAKSTGSKTYNPTKEYTAGDTAVKSEQIYQAKVVTQDQTVFKLETVQPVTFRWSSTVPKPTESVTYRLKVWQLMQGQNGTQAMRENTPVVTKEITDSSEATVSGIYTGPCKPPYLCDFVWSVEAISAAGTQTGSTEVTKPAETDAGVTDPATGASGVLY
jgi:hypothetical protein